MTFDDNLVVLLVNACIQNNVKEEVQTMHFLMWLAGTYKITMSSLKDLVNFTSNCLNNSSTDIFYNNNNTNISDSFQISKNLEPIGIIRYFPFALKNSECWLPCNGMTYKASKYPELYRLITNNYSMVELK